MKEAETTQAMSVQASLRNTRTHFPQQGSLGSLFLLIYKYLSVVDSSRASAAFLVSPTRL